MSIQEYINITNFINGTINDEEREKISSQINNRSLKANIKEMEKQDKKQFDSDIAWNKLHKKIEDNGLLGEKNKILISFSRIAASIIIIIGLSLSGYFIFNNSQTKFSVVNTANEIKEITLPDGSQIYLNHNSSIKYSQYFSEKNRIVEFSGEAFFKVCKNKEMPFVIKFNNAEVKVLGTSFNIDATNKSNIKVTVKTGKVQLTKNKIEKVKLIAGEIGTIENNILIKSKNKDKNYLAWKTKHFEYEGEKLSKVIADINKAYHVNIVFEDDKIGELLFSTPINNKELDAVLGLICSPDNLKFEKTNNKIIISRK